MYRITLVGLSLLGLALFGRSGFAAESASQTSARVKNKLGSYLAINEPSPTIIGVNLAYNPTDFLRISAGYGKISVTTGISISAGGNLEATEASASTFGLGVRGFVPGWDLSPTVGLHYGLITYSGTGLEVGGFTESGGHMYVTMGADWQTDMGLNVSLGYKHSFKSGIGGGFYLGAGWFTNLLG